MIKEVENMAALPMGACPYCGRAFAIWTKKMELEIVVGVKRLLLFKMVRLLGGDNYLHIVCK